MAVIGHVHHGHECDTPRILRWNLPGMLALAFDAGITYQNWCCPVELFGQLGIAFAAEHRTGQCIGVDQPEVFWCQREPPAFVGQLADLGGKADKLGLFGCAQGEQAELHAAVHGGEQLVPVFDVVQADQPFRLCDVAKVRLGAVVGGNACGYDEAGPAVLGVNLQDGFGKQGVGVHVTHPGERVAPSFVFAYMGKKARGFCCAAGSDELAVQASFGIIRAICLLQRWCAVWCWCAAKVQVLRQSAFAEPLDTLAALGLVACCCHVGVAGGKEFFFLQFDALPRRVAQHTVKTPVAVGSTGRKHLRKRQGPVEHACLGAGSAGRCHRIGGGACDAVGYGQQGVQRGAGWHG